MPLNDATLAFLTEMADAGGKAIHESTPEEVRALGETLSELYGAGPEMARVEDHTITTDDCDSFPVRILVPQGTARGVIVYYHGGGWVIGNIDEYDTLGRKLAASTGCAVVMVGYRLAPEHRYPTAVDDAYAALEWTDARIVDIAGAQVPLVVSGDSAGGNLSAVMTLRSRERNGPAIAFQALVYPVTDADVNNATYSDAENQLMLSRDTMIWFWDHYAPESDRRSEPDASPLHATDLSGLPPAVVITAEFDVLREEGEAYASRLRDAGVSVVDHRHAGQMHGFFSLLMLPGHELVIEQITDALDDHLPAASRK